MKNKIIIITLLLTGLFIGCDEDGYDKPNSFSDVGWYTSKIAEPLNTAVGEYISFSDLSQGTLEHKWTIGEGNFYIEGPFASKDSMFDQKIISPINTVSLDETVHVLFKESGLQEVNLYNTFKDSVSFRSHLGDFPSEKIGDKWVIDTTFVVDVYGTIVPVMQIEKDGVITAHENEMDTIYVEAGGRLKFTNLSTIGRPDTFNWKIGTSFGSGEDASIIFKKLGVFEGVFTASRSENGIPGGRSVYNIPAPFKVIPSTKPFVVFGIAKEQEDETIQVSFNGEFAPFVDQEDFFTVKVNDVEFPIASVSINTTDATILDIKLVAPIYRPDAITVSYAGGTLQSTDTRLPVAFTDLPVKMHDVNLWDDTIYGFEDNSGSWTHTTDEGTGTYSTEQAASGDYSIKLTSDGAWSRVSGEANPVVVEGGKTYTISWKVWIDPSTTSPSFGPFFYFSGGNQQFWKSLKGLPREEWITMSRDYEVKVTGPVSFAFRVNKDAILYLDDIRIVETEIRP